MSKNIKCSIEGCEEIPLSRGWCKNHYNLWYRNKGTDEQMLISRLPEGAKCSVDECERNAYVRGWCKIHYNRWLRRGDPSAPYQRVYRYGDIPCPIEGCKNEVEARGLCNSHHTALLRREKQERLMGRPRAKLCEICGNPASGNRGERKICFDHDHVTGKPRGWICPRCNKCLGLANDDIATLKMMIAYLDKHKNGDQ